MDNSPQNPYIPQESERIRQQVYERQSPLGKAVKISLIVTIVVAVLVGAGLFFVIPRTEAKDQSAREALADILQPPALTQKRVSVESDRGFKLQYDNNVYSSYAEVGDSTSGTDESTAIIAGQRYDNNELRIKRAYNYVRIRPVESVATSRTLTTLPPQLEIFATITSEDLEKAATNAENKDLTKLNLFIKLDTDKRLEKKVADDNTIVDIDVSNAVAAKIGDTDYQRVRFTTTNKNYRIENVKYDDCYYTIQNDMPYSVCLTGVRPSNIGAASLVEKVLSSITYQKVATNEESQTDESGTEKTAYALLNIRLAQVTTQTEEAEEDQETDAPGSEETADMSPLQTVKPEYYENESSLVSIVKNQPSVVRIGMIYCADLALKYQDGEVASTLTDACTGSVSTGTIISKDGYVATTGHAVRSSKKAAINGYINSGATQDAMIDRLQRVIDYLLKSDLLMQTDADYIIQGAKIGDQEALAKVENLTSVIPDNFITSIKEEYSYAIQPGDKAIVVNRTDTNKPSFAYSDSIFSAKYISSDFEAEKIMSFTFSDATPAKDVGLLKIESDNEFQPVPLAVNEETKSNDILNIVGYSAYTDGSLTITKIRNMPIAEVHKVEQAYEKDGSRLIQTNTPVLPGSGGAPVLNASGELSGFASYGFAYCPGQQCFASGTLRSSSELQKLLSNENISLNTNSKASEVWRKGITEYFRANYGASTPAFSSAGSLYPFNRWATEIKDLSQSNKGNESDTSLMNQLQAVMVISIIILSVLSVLLIIAFMLHRRRISNLQIGHYGLDTPAAQPASVSQPQGYPAPQQQPQPLATPPAELPPLQYPQNQVPQAYAQPTPGGRRADVPPVQPNDNLPMHSAPGYSPERPSEPKDPFYK